MKSLRSLVRSPRAAGVLAPIGVSTFRLAGVLSAVLGIAGCVVGLEDEGLDDEHDHGAGEVDLHLAAAGAGDRYGCVTTSQPGCDLAVGIGRSLYGAGECKPGVDFHVSVRDADRSRPVILAIHGGTIEDGTAQLATLLASELGWDWYVFRATPTSDTCRDAAWMHVTSTRFNSATALGLARSHPAAVSLHGYNERNPARAGWPQDRWFVCVGGTHAAARARFIASLNQPALSLDGRRVVAVDATAGGSATGAVCGGLGGTGATNIANLPRDGGLQLELPRRLRARIAGLDGLSPSATLRARLVAAVRAAL